MDNGSSGKDVDQTGTHPRKSPWRKRRKKKSPSANARDKTRLKRFLEREAAVNSKSATTETTQPSLKQDKRSIAVPCELDSIVFSASKALKYTEELENNSLCTDQDLTCCSESRGLTSLENPTSINTCIPEADLLAEQAVLCGFLDTIDIDSDDDDVCGISVCANCKRQPPKRRKT